MNVELEKKLKEGKIISEKVFYPNKILNFLEQLDC